jgi:uncharacterized protein YaeQ
MALNSTMFRFKIKLSDVDRGVYESLELRAAMHPSEAVPFFMARLLAYCLNYQEGIEFSRGISTPDEPALFVKDLTGLMKLWIDIGNPSARRLHKASKAAERVRVYTHRDPEILKKEVSGEEVYRRDEIEVFALMPDFLNKLGTTLARDNAWELLHTEGELSISTKEATFTGDVVAHRL